MWSFDMADDERGPVPERGKPRTEISKSDHMMVCAATLMASR